VETKEVIGRFRLRWANTPFADTFEKAYKRALKDDNFRAHPGPLSEGDADPGRIHSPTSGLTFPSPDDFFIIIGYIVVGVIGFLIIGGLLSIWFRTSGRSTAPHPQEPQTSDTYGSADYAAPRAGIPDPAYIASGVFFGKSSTPSPYESALFDGGPICSTPEHHTLVVARTRTGKGTRVIVPTLLRYANGSALVIDPKSENTAITARARAALGQKIHIINPWGEKAAVFQRLGLSTDTYNPLDILDRRDENVVANAESLALAICPIEKGSREQYWTNSAASLLTAVLLYLTDQPGETKTLARARDIITRSRADFKSNFLAKMAASSAFDGAIRENAASFLDLADVTYSGVISNLNTSMKFLSDPQTKKNTATSSFSMEELISAKTTLYIIVPPKRAKTQKTWLRLLISAGMQTFKNNTGPVTQRCMFLIDELAALGKLEDLPDDTATMAGAGVDFALVVQGLDQLKEHYGDSYATIVNNCAYQWFCNVNDLDSAKYLSQVLGKKTVQTTSKSSSMGMSQGHGSSSESTTSGETSRDLLMPDEAMRLGRDVAILIAPNSRPQYLKPIDYWDLPNAFVSLKQHYPHLYWNPPLRYDPNPYRAS